MNQVMKGNVIRTLKCFVFTGVFSLLAASSFAGSMEAPDSLRTRTVNGQKVRLHKVLPKETWTGVSRQYGIEITTLQRANPGVNELKIGQIINIPLSEKGQTVATDAAASPSPVKEDAVPVQVESPAKETPQTEVRPKYAIGAMQIHTVQRGETLFSIATKYNLSVAELKDMNKLTSNNIALGRKLIVALPSASEPVATPAPVKEKPAEIKTITKTESKPSPTTEPSAATKSKSSSKTDASGLPKAYTNPGASRTSKREKDEKTGADVEKFEEVGLVAWFGSDTDMNPTKFYALHRMAPIGAIIKVTNRMNNNSVYVKVVGILPDTGDNENLICKITQAAAQRIGALDQRFTAELSYGVTIGLVDSGE
jgi:LysM repeat protein